MASALKRVLPAFLATLLLEWFAVGLHPLWPLMWVAPLPMLLLAPVVSWWLAGLAAFLAWFAGAFTLWGYFTGTIHMPAGVALGIFTLMAVRFALPVLLFRALVKRGMLWLALTAAPALSVGLDYLTSLISVHGTHGSPSYTQLDFLPALQAASVAGPWGITFLLLLFTAALALLVGQYREPRARLIGGVGLAVVAASLVAGEMRVIQPQAGQLVKVGLVASDLKENQGVADPGEPAARRFADYAREAAALAQQGAQVVVIPENLAVVTAPGDDHVFQDLADSSGIQIVAGMLRVEGGRKYNEARLYTPHAPEVAYDKQHLLPPFESPLTPGSELIWQEKPEGVWGLAICKDMDFTSPSSRYGAAGAGLMLVPAWDFVDDAWAHGHIAIMRAVEGGFSLVRAARGGYLTVADDRGRVVAETASWSAAYASLVAEVPGGHEKTFYLRFGDWLAKLSLVFLVGVLLRLVLVRRPTP